MFKKKSSYEEASILSYTQFKEVLFFISSDAESEIDTLKADVRSICNLNFLR